ncbi:anti-CBASS protein Acb1 family protein, partial [Achromobacter xylosoxidans]
IPYVNNWLKTRQAVANLIDGFSVGVFKTNLQSILSGDPGDDVFARIDVFNRTRTNRGVFAVNKEDEEFGFENVPLSGLDALQNQSLEQLCVVPGIPLVKYTGITPSGLNATVEGEIRVFYDEMVSAQEAVFRDPLQQCLEVIQLSEFGEIDPDITFSFVPLWQMSEKELAEVRKLDADTGAVLIESAAISPQEERERVAADETNGYHSLDLADDDADGVPDSVPGAPPPLDDEPQDDANA